MFGWIALLVITRPAHHHHHLSFPFPHVEGEIEG